MKTKTFDCVEMKQRVQAELMAEYEAHRNQFASFADFIHKTASADLKILAFQKKISNVAPQGNIKHQI